MTVKLYSMESIDDHVLNGVIRHSVRDYSSLTLTYDSRYVNWGEDNFIQVFGTRTSGSLTEGYYEGSWDFNDEDVGDYTSDPTDLEFVDEATLYDASLSIESEVDEHKNVLKLQDDLTSGENPYIIHEFSSNLTSGTMELYFRTDDVSKTKYLLWIDTETAGDNIMTLKIYNSKLYYLGAGPTYHEIGAINSNQWYHVKIKWRADNTHDIYINGTKEVDNQQTGRNMTNGIDKFKIHNAGDSESFIYLDAIGLVGVNGYVEGDNLPVHEREGVIFEGKLQSIQDMEEGSVYFKEATFLSETAIDLLLYKPNKTVSSTDTDGHVSELLEDCSYITEGSLSDGVALDNTQYRGGTSFKLLLTQLGAMDQFQWYLTPKGELHYDDGATDTNVRYSETLKKVFSVVLGKRQSRYNKIRVKGSRETDTQPNSGWVEDSELVSQYGEKSVEFIIPWIMSDSNATTMANSLLTLLKQSIEVISFSVRDTLNGLLQVGETLSFSYSPKNISEGTWYLQEAEMEIKTGIITYVASNMLQYNLDDFREERNEIDIVNEQIDQIDSKINESCSINYLEGATYTTVNDWFNIVESGAVITGGTITDNGDGTVSVSAGTGIIKDTDSEVATAYSFDWEEESSISLTDDSINYIYIDYNGGNPQMGVTTNKSNINDRTRICIGRVYREGTTLHIMNDYATTTEVSLNTHRRLAEVSGFDRSSGMITSETGTRNIAITSGSFYYGLNHYTTPAFDSSGTDEFIYLYRDGGSGWTKVSGQTQIDNTHYDDNSGTLATLTANRYGVHWVYMLEDGTVYVVYGQGDYKLAEALAALAPNSLPVYITEIGMLVAKIIIQKNASSFHEILIPFETGVEFAPATDHGGLAGLEDDDHSQYLLVNGSRAMTGNLNMDDNDITNVGAINGINMTKSGFMVYNSGASQTATDNTWTKITWSTEYYDLNSDFDLANDKFIAPVDGIYLFSISIYTAVVDWTVGDAITLAIYKNGAQYKWFYKWWSETTFTSTWGIKSSMLLKLSTNDYIEAYIRIARGANTDFGGGEFKNQYFEGLLIR